MLLARTNFSIAFSNCKSLRQTHTLDMGSTSCFCFLLCSCGPFFLSCNDLSNTYTQEGGVTKPAATEGCAFWVCCLDWMGWFRWQKFALNCVKATETMGRTDTLWKENKLVIRIHKVCLARTWEGIQDCIYQLYWVSTGILLLLSVLGLIVC